jgi:hypothetical protein
LKYKLRVSDKTIVLQGLLHDSEEGLGVKDTISGFKYVLGPAYIEIGLAIRETIFFAFGLPWPPSEKVTRLIKKADHISAATEAIHLMNFKLDDYRKRVNRRVFPLVLNDEWRELLTPWPPKVVEERFLEELWKLSAKPRPRQE